MSDGTEPDDRDGFEDEADEGAEYSLETNEADAAEQHLDLLQHRDAPLAGLSHHEVDPGDAEEQRRVVDSDEDDYRE